MNVKRELVPATQALARQFYGSSMPRPSMRALVLLEDEVPAGIGGLARVQGGMLLFMQYRGESRDIPLSLYKGARQMLALADKKGWIVYAEADLTVSPAAERFLERLGFEPIEKGYRRVPRG